MNDKDFDKEVRVKTLNILAVAALKDDVILLLHQDRRDHVLMNFAYDIDRHSIEEQQAVALIVGISHRLNIMLFSNFTQK